MKKRFVAGLGFVAGALIIFIVLSNVPSKCTSTRNYNQAITDSLIRVAKGHQQMAAYYKGQAELAYDRGMAAEKAKVVIRTIYRKDTAANHRLKKHLKDSIIKAMFAKDPTMDSSIFSDPVANGVLDLQSDNSALRSEAKQDSSTIRNLKHAYHTLDSACNECQQANRAKDAQLVISNENTANAEKEAKKQGILKWIAIGIATLVAIAAAAF